MKQTGFDLNFRDKYDTLAFMHYIKNPGYNELFKVAEGYPNILKLFIYGRRDTLFETRLINEKVIFYSYKNKMDSELESKLAKKYEMMRGSKEKNLQERFICAIPKGHFKEINYEVIG